MKLSDYVENIRAIVRESAASEAHDMGADVYTLFIRSALKKYSQDRPYYTVKQFAGDSGRYYPIYNYSTLVVTSNFTGFVVGFSLIDKVEAIAADITNEETPNYIERDSWELYKDDTDVLLYLRHHAPSANDNIRVTISVPHTINGLDGETVDTISVTDQEALFFYGASKAFMSLAGKYVGTRNPTINADAVNYRTKSAEMISLAKEYMKLYTGWVEEAAEAAAITRDVDFHLGSGHPYLTHRGSGRVNVNA